MITLDVQHRVVASDDYIRFCGKRSRQHDIIKRVSCDHIGDYGRNNKRTERRIALEESRHLKPLRSEYAQEFVATQHSL